VRYAERGYPVFPTAPSKRPLVAHGHYDATLDRAQIGAWWDRWSDAGVAIRTGAASGLLVLDVDGDAGHDALYHLERKHGALPRTASVRTPRGGAHLYFKHPGGTVGCSASRLGPGLDVRGDGGYVIAPPSSGANGRRYEPDEQAPTAPIPTWLEALLRRAAPDIRRRREPVDTWLRIVRGVAEGERNAALTRLVGHLLAHDVDIRLVAELALLVDQRNDPPIGTCEVDRIVESIAGRELRRRRPAV
jgi:hypothetical protein